MSNIMVYGFFLGDSSAENRTVIGDPKRAEEFKEKLEVSIKYAKALDCPL